MSPAAKVSSIKQQTDLSFLTSFKLDRKKLLENLATEYCLEIFCRNSNEYSLFLTKNKFNTLKSILIEYVN